MRILLILLVLFLNLILSGQNLSTRFRHLSLEQGLSQANARCFVQDKNGLMWIGTQDGLHRYDGYDFTVFRQDLQDSNSITGNLITCLYEDRERLIWIGTLGGLTSYDPDKGLFKKYKPNHDKSDWLHGESVIAIYQDSRGLIWLGTYLGGLSCFDKKTGKFRNYLNDPQDPHSINNNSILSITEDKKGNLWLGTFGGGLNKFNPNTGKAVHYLNTISKNSICSDIVNCLTFEPSGELLIGTTNGLSIMDTDKELFYNRHFNPNEVHLNANHVQALHVDRSGIIWLGTAEGGLLAYNRKTEHLTCFQKNYLDPYSLNDNSIYAIYEDKDEMLWVGTAVGGINQYKKRSKLFHSVTKDSRGISHNSIRSVLKDTKGNLWVGTDYGLNKFDEDGKTLTKYLSDPSDQRTLSNDKIWALIEDKDGNIWICTQMGLNKYDHRQDRFFRYIHIPGNDRSIPFNILRSMYYDRNGVLWIGTYGGGLIRYNMENESFKSYLFNRNSNSISDNIVFNISKGNGKYLWISTTLGLNKFDPEENTFEHYFSKKTDLSSALTFYCSYQDQNGICWLGTLDGGFIKLNPLTGKYSHFKESDGLASAVVYGILPDAKNNLWLSTNRGISKFNIASQSFKNYTISEGLASSEYNTGAFLRSASGIMYFGGIDGLSYFNPDSIVSNTRSPQIVISAFKIFDEPVNVNKVIVDGDIIELDYTQNYFSFDLASLDYTEPDKNLYAYKLDGYDKNWVNAGRRRYAAYTNVDPGEYTLLVKATNSDGFWNENGISVKLVINPPYWMTWWFKTLVTLIAGGLILTFYLSRINKIQKDKLAQEEFSKKLIDSQEYERKRIAGELHDGIGQNLLIIKNRARMGIKNPTDIEMRKQLELISGFASESIVDIRNIAYNLHPYHLEEVGLTATINSMLNKFSESSSVKFTPFIECVDNLFNSETEINIFRIVQESLNNIVKHSQASESVISISKNETVLKISISDNGIGIDQRSLAGRQKGLGLKGLTERTKFCRGVFNIESVPGKGTIIKVTIPINTAYERNQNNYS